LSLESDILERHELHLLVVDDDNRIRDLLRKYLTRQGYRVSVASGASDARRLMKTLTFDLVILDVMMPEETGFEFTAALRKSGNIPIILLTAKGEAQSRIEGLKLGADDYISKPFEPEELVLRIEAIFRRLGTRSPKTKVLFGPWEYDLQRLTLHKSGERVRLTTGEEALLTLLAKCGGAPVSRYALSEKIKAKSERAVDVQMTRLRRKIEDNPSEPRYILTVRGHGYRLLTDNPT